MFSLISRMSCGGDANILFCGIQMAIFGLVELYFGFLVLITSSYYNYGGECMKVHLISVNWVIFRLVLWVLLLCSFFT